MEDCLICGRKLYHDGSCWMTCPTCGRSGYDKDTELFEVWTRCQDHQQDSIYTVCRKCLQLAPGLVRVPAGGVDRMMAWSRGILKRSDCEALLRSMLGKGTDAKIEPTTLNPYKRKKG